MASERLEVEEKSILSTTFRNASFPCQNSAKLRALGAKNMLTCLHAIMLIHMKSSIMLIHMKSKFVNYI